MRTPTDDRELCVTTFPAVPKNYREGFEDYHRLAYAVVSNARKQATGRIGLRPTGGGFGTPVFGDDEQVRVDGVDLVRERAGELSRRRITTLADAAAFAGTVATDDQAEADTVAMGDVHRQLRVTPEVGAFLDHWFAFGAAALVSITAMATEEDDVSPIQLWPGHFDVATEIGSADAGQRATYGASPGDASHDEPYLYVASWADIDRSDPYWNEEGFDGASLSYAELGDADDPEATARAFFAAGYGILHA